MAESISGIIVSRSGAGIVIQQTGGPPGPEGPPSATVIGGIPGLQDALDAKQDASTAVTDTELTTALSAKQDASTAATDTELGSEATARSDADAAHAALTTSVHGIPDTNELATKAYADALASGLLVKPAVRLATAAALPANTRSGNVLTASANGALTVDGTAVVNGDRVLVKNEVLGANNGFYDVTAAGSGGAPFVLTRSSDADTSGEILTGVFVFVVAGSTNISTGWGLITPPTITLNTTALTFTQVSALGSTLAGFGLTKTGNTIDITEPELLGLAGVTPAGNKFPYFTGSGSAMALADVSPFLRSGSPSFLASTTAAEARAAIGAVSGSEITANTVTGDYTLVLGDAGKAVEMNAAAAKVITVPPNSSVAFAIGTLVEVCRLGAGGLSVAAGSGVTIRSPGGGLSLFEQYSEARLRKRATNEWVLTGDVV